MISRPLVAALLAAGCLTAAASGAYFAVRHNAADPQPAAASAPVPLEGEPSGGAVAETEAIVETPKAGPPMPQPTNVAPTPEPARRPARRPAAVKEAAPRTARRVARPEPSVSGAPGTGSTPVPAPRTEPVESPAAEPEPLDVPVERPDARWADPVVTAPVSLPNPPAAAAPEFDQIVIPASSVIGLQVETTLTSERAQIEDRVEARVNRDVMSGGRVAIAAGSRVTGVVTLVERGGKVKQRARLGVRFHTLVLADGRRVPLHTEPILREGEPPSSESARKIGGAAIGGAILGAIMGGGKGAVIGGATGAGAGTAAVMAGDRNAATLPAGTVVTVRLTSPITLELERH